MARRKSNLIIILLLVFSFATLGCTKKEESKKEVKKAAKKVAPSKKVKKKKFQAVKTEGSFLIIPFNGLKYEGDDNAKVIIMEFTDFQCPFCRRFHKETLPFIEENYINTGKVKLITRAFPLPFHIAATPAAKALYCVGKFGTDKQYWEFYNNLFMSDSINPSTPFEIAEKMGLNREKIAQCVSSEDAQNFIKKENSDGTIYGVTGTPTFFIGIDKGDGTMKAIKVVGAQPFNQFKEKLDNLLKTVK